MLYLIENLPSCLDVFINEDGEKDVVWKTTSLPEHFEDCYNIVTNIRDGLMAKWGIHADHEDLVGNYAYDHCMHHLDDETLKIEVARNLVRIINRLDD